MTRVRKAAAPDLFASPQDPIATDPTSDPEPPAQAPPPDWHPEPLTRPMPRPLPVMTLPPRPVRDDPARAEAAYWRVCEANRAAYRPGVRDAGAWDRWEAGWVAWRRRVAAGR
jgi:hypothetical protein